MKHYQKWPLRSAIMMLLIVFSSSLNQVFAFENNTQLVDLSDLKSPLLLHAAASQQILTQSENWEISSYCNSNWPSSTGTIISIGFPTVVKNTKGPNPDGKYYLFYAQHDPTSGIGCAVSLKIDGPYTKLTDLPGSTRTDSQVLVNPKFNSLPNPGSCAHYSSPVVVWNNTAQKWYMYFHFYNDGHTFAWKDSTKFPTLEGNGDQLSAVATCADLTANVWTPIRYQTTSTAATIYSYYGTNATCDNLVPVIATTDATWMNSQSSYHKIQQLHDGTWVAMLRGTSTEGKTSIGFATSTDGINWNMPTGPVFYAGDGGGGRDGCYRPGFVGYLGKTSEGVDNYLVAWSESSATADVPLLTYATTTDFVTFTRSGKYSSFASGDGSISAWREGENLYLFTGTTVYTVNLDVEPMPSWQPCTVDANTVSLYHLDEGTGTVITSETGDVYNGTKKNGTSADWVPGMFDDALTFYNNRRVEFTNGLYNDRSMTASTIEFWAKPADIDGSGFVPGVMFSQWRDNNAFFVIGINNNKVRVWWKNMAGVPSAMYSTITVPDGQWHHIALVMDGTHWKLYVDGGPEPQATAAETAVFSDYTGEACRTYLGCQYLEGSGTLVYYEGYLDEVRISDKARFYGKYGELTQGDANSDGMVDVSDLGILAANYGMINGATWAQGDFNADGAVDVSDLGILAANYGTGTSGVDFTADYEKVFGTTADSETDIDTDSSTCNSLGLSLIAGLILAGLMLVKVEDQELF